MGRTWVWVMLGVLAAFPAWSAEVHDVRLWRAPDHTRIVFDLTGPAEHKLIVLDNPCVHRYLFTRAHVFLSC